MNERILLVEDDPMNMRLLKMALRGKGYRLLEATDGQSAQGWWASLCSAPPYMA